MTDLSLPPLPGRRSAILASWGTAWLAGTVSLDEVVARVTAGDEPHRVGGLSAEPEPVALGWALGRLRAHGARALRLLLPVPGDVRGVPGPAHFRAAAVATGEGVVTAGDGARLGLLPAVTEHGHAAEGHVRTVLWRAVEVEEPPLADAPYLRDAERDLTAALKDATAALVALDVARCDPEVVAALARLRDDGRRPDAVVLPTGYSPAAARLAAQAVRLSAVLALAHRDDGAAVTGREVRGRGDALRALATAVTRARLAAVNDTTLAAPSRVDR